MQLPFVVSFYYNACTCSYSTDSYYTCLQVIGTTSSSQLRLEKNVKFGRHRLVRLLSETAKAVKALLGDQPARREVQAGEPFE